jgi:hypothetical protein
VHPHLIRQAAKRELERSMHLGFYRIKALGSLDPQEITNTGRSGTVCRMELPDCVREESWLIVALTRSNDETSEQADTGERGEDGPGYSQSHTVGRQRLSDGIT